MKKIYLTVSIYLFIFGFIKAQTQIGSDIDGEELDRLGRSVSISADGNLVAIGAPLSNGFFDLKSGKLKMYRFNGVQWVQEGSAIEGADIQHLLGSSVSISADGQRVAVGAFGGVNVGYVQIYEWNGADWTPMGDKIEGLFDEDGTGGAVSLSADGLTVALGGNQIDGNGSSAGHARAFRWSGSDWGQIGSTLNGEADGDGYGSAVSLSADGERLAVGGERNNNFTGHVRVFDFNGSNWNQVGSDLDGENLNNFFGESIALSADGNRLAVGASGHEDKGQVKMFEWNGGSWVQLGNDMNGNSSDDRIGNSVTLNAAGTRLASGAIFSESNAGKTSIFDWIGGAWVQAGNDIIGEAANNFSGAAISFSSEGTSLIIGADNNQDGGFDAGHARVFEVPLPTVPHDKPCDAFTLPTDGTVQSGFSNVGATVDTGEGAIVPVDENCETSWCEYDVNEVNNSIWFKFSAPPSGQVEISTCDLADFDTQIALYAVGSCNDYSTYTLIAANDDGPATCSTEFDSWMYASGLDSGQEYYILVDGWYGESGEFGISVTESIVNSTQEDIANKASNFDLFPNPNNGKFWITMTNLTVDSQLKIHDFTGKLIHTKAILQGNENTPIEIENLIPGTYTITLISGNSTLIETMVVR